MLASLFLNFLFFVSYSSSFEYTQEDILDQVTNLPVLSWEPNFNQFSGYLNLEGCK